MKRRLNMVKKILLSMYFLISIASLGFADDAMVEVEGRYWVTELDGKCKVVESSIGTSFDFDSDLGIDDENLPEARFTLKAGPFGKIRACYTQVEYSGEKNITQSISFKGQTYTAGTRVESDFDIQYLRVGWIWQFIDLMDKVKVGPLVELKGVQGEVMLNAPSLSIKESEDFLGALPTPGLIVDVNPIEKVNIFAEISGLPAGDYGHFFDAEAGLKYIPIKNVSITGGFRIIDIKLKDDPDFLKAQITGPFISATVRF